MAAIVRPRARFRNARTARADNFFRPSGIILLAAGLAQRVRRALHFEDSFTRQERPMRFFFTSLLLTSLALHPARAAEPVADLIFHNGKVVTVDKPFTIAK